ncbi:uncharacterized protein [Choristoneura fumiferana]|uniref:uncharacterized protein n=1 Tax=Choristoneura fumiferana TaxID=7141 RepID=UPI003D15D2E1
MKTLVVLSALAAIAIAGPTIPIDETTDFDVTKIGKRSPTLHKGYGHIVAPIHPVPVVHHTYVQPVIPHHLGLKKPLIFNHHHGHLGHHGHVFRSEDEEVEAHSAESKETKNKCMKEMEAKCDDEIIAKSSELTDGVQIDDSEDDISESEVAQSLQMAKEAVNALQKKLQRAEQNSRMTQWKQGDFESDVKLQREVETAKQALDQMQLNFGNLESMNVQMHASAFKEADVPKTHLELTKSEEERIAQWKDAIENIEMNVELVKNIEDSFQNTQHIEMKSAALENSSFHKQARSENQPSSLAVATHAEQSGFSKDATEMRIDGKSADSTSSWKAHGKSANIESSNLKTDLESSASTLSESTAALHSTNEHKEQSVRNEQGQSFGRRQKEIHSGQGSHGLVQSQTNLGISHNQHQLSSSQNHQQLSSSHNHNQLSSSHNARQLALGHGNIQNFKDDHSMIATEAKMGDKQMSSQLVKTTKSSEGSELNVDHEKIGPTIDTTNLMKSADHQIQAKVIDNSENLEKSSLKNEASKFENSTLKHEEIEAKSSHFDNSEASRIPSIDTSLSSNDQGKSAEHEKLMKLSDQMVGQSQQSEVAAALQHMPSGQLEKSKQLHSFSVHGKSADGVSDSASLQISPNGLHSGFKSSLDVPKSKSWKDASFHASSRGAYGSGLSLGGGYGASSYGASGYGAGATSGAGAVGVFPNAHVGNCAIPLLLSCSPNVAAGHLAKSHSSYSAPSYASQSYRNTETTNTHSKRDITKIGSPTKVKRTPIRNLKQKSILITDRL